MTIHLCEDHSSDIHTSLEGTGLVICSLTNATVHNEYGQIGLHCCCHLLHFFQKSRLLLVPTAGIDDDQIHLLFFEEIHTFLCDLGRIGFCVVTIIRYFHLSRVLLQLVVRTSTIRIGADHRNLETFSLVVQSVLCNGGCFSCSLKTDEHDNILLPLLKDERGVAWIDHSYQLFEHCTLNCTTLIDTGSIFVGIYCVSNILTQFTYSANVNIGRKERRANLFQAGVDDGLVHNRGIAHLPQSGRYLAS
mmetsp:Transcript_13944/g.16824  ORF Transcript_13944/g.16824 Transcript_13944/m.16824 type:complete len:248 (+) Transcript_13944:1307-2050(+)